MRELEKVVQRHKAEHERQRRKPRGRPPSKPLGTAMVIRALRETEGDVPKASDILGCDKSHLWRYLRTDAVAKTALNEMRAELRPNIRGMPLTPQEVARMKDALWKAEGRVSQAAKILGVGENALYSRIASRLELRRILRQARPTETQRKNRRPVVVVDPCVCGHAREGHYGTQRGKEHGACMHSGCYDTFAEQSDCPGYRPAESLRRAA